MIAALATPSAYRGASALASPLIDAWLLHRSHRGKEDGARLSERLGRAGRPRPPGPLVWLHGASVGEILSLLPLIERLGAERPDAAALVTSGTVTSAALATERLPETAFHQYVPVDHPGAVRRFLDHWRPDLAVWVESELWPNLILQTRARGTPMLLVNGRMSARSAARWQRMPRLIAPLLGAFRAILAQSEADAARFAALGACSVEARGNLKYDAAPLPADARVLDGLRRDIGARRCWLAASTHPGEEEIAADAHAVLSREIDGLLTIVAPRHPERGPEIADALRLRPLRVARRAAGEPIAAETELYLADTLGELGLFYRLAGVALIGGSLVRHGGHNPLEAARLDCAVVTGPHHENFTEPYAALRDASAVETVEDAEALVGAVRALLDDGAHGRARVEAATAVVRALDGAADAALALILDTLTEHEGGARPRVLGV